MTKRQWSERVLIAVKSSRIKNVSLYAHAAILPHVRTITEVVMNRVRITGGDLQRLLARDYPQYRSITDACKFAASEYGLTPETMRCYAASGVPMRSRAYNKIRSRLMALDQEEAEAMVSVTVATKKLSESIDLQIRAFETAVASLKKLRIDLNG